MLPSLYIENIYNTLFFTNDHKPLYYKKIYIFCFQLLPQKQKTITELKVKKLMCLEKY